MNVLPRDQQIAVLNALIEGCSLRATARLTGVARNTISDLLRDVGAHCKNHHDRFVRGVAAKRVQADEAWSFCGKKDKRAKPEEKLNGLGDAWTWCAIDQDSKLVISYKLGQRTSDMADALMLDLHDRLIGRCQLTTDALQQYRGAVEKAFTWGGVDYSMLRKVFSKPQKDDRRYSPAVVVSVEKYPIMGNPKTSDVCTSHIERQNLTLRMQSRRYTRLTKL